MLDERFTARYTGQFIFADVPWNSEQSAQNPTRHVPYASTHLPPIPRRATRSTYCAHDGLDVTRRELRVPGTSEKQASRQRNSSTHCTLHAKADQQRAEGPHSRVQQMHGADWPLAGRRPVVASEERKCCKFHLRKLFNGGECRFPNLVCYGRTAALAIPVGAFAILVVQRTSSSMLSL